MRPLLAVLVAVAVAVAGCATEEKDDQDPTGSSGDPAVNNTTSAPVVFKGEGQVTAGAVGASLGSGGVEFTVESGATLLFAELAWDDEVQDLDLSLSSPSAVRGR
ncbi:MAG: hypothetical protein KY455_04440 [Euryarchaeota archaeon]|nr:hypothetical protein [Euryarchaeota archaeon]